MSKPLTEYRRGYSDGLRAALDTLPVGRTFSLRDPDDFRWLADYFSGYHGIPGLRAERARPAPPDGLVEVRDALVGKVTFLLGVDDARLALPAIVRYIDDAFALLAAQPAIDVEALRWALWVEFGGGQRDDTDSGPPQPMVPTDPYWLEAATRTLTIAREYTARPRKEPTMSDPLTPEELLDPEFQSWAASHRNGMHWGCAAPSACRVDRLVATINHLLDYARSAPPLDVERLTQPAINVEAHCEGCREWVSKGSNDGSGEYPCPGTSLDVEALRVAMDLATMGPWRHVPSAVQGNASRIEDDRQHLIADHVTNPNGAAIVACVEFVRAALERSRP